MSSLGQQKQKKSESISSQVRDWLHKCLYDAEGGYFSRSATPVGILEQPLDVPSLWDFAHYQSALRQAYQRLQAGPCRAHA